MRQRSGSATCPHRAPTVPPGFSASPVESSVKRAGGSAPPSAAITYPQVQDSFVMRGSVGPHMAPRQSQQRSQRVAQEHSLRSTVPLAPAGSVFPS